MYTPKLLQVAQIGHPVLRERAKEVKTPLASELREFCSDLVATCQESEGMGIAAPQVYKSHRIIVMWPHPCARYPNVPTWGGPTVMVNPEIVSHSEEEELGYEGCLSVPGIRALVPRRTSLKVCWDGPEDISRAYSLEIDDPFWARVFQHELDHLNGKMFLDRAKPRTIVTDKEYFRLLAVQQKPTRAKNKKK